MPHGGFLLRFPTFPGFQAVPIAATPDPQRLMYLALHNDYSEIFNTDTRLSERRCGEIAVERLLQGNRGHFGVLEHPQFSIALRADHNTIMQLRTHRIGLTFDCQSMRYSGKRIERLAEGELDTEDVFYVRPPGHYRDRQGDPYEWSEDDRTIYLDRCLQTAQAYYDLRKQGVSEEHARGVLATSYYQNCYLSGTLRAMLHLLDVRLKADAQLEIQSLMAMIADHIQRWVPEIYAWYEENRLGRARLAP